MVTAEDFAAQVQAGKKVEAHDEMSEEYREALINLMMQQADSELSGAYGYVPWIERAPNIHEKLLVAQIVKDEVNHAYRMFKLLKDLGIDCDDRIAKMDLDGVEPTSHVVELQNVLRDDVPRESLSRERALEGAPEQVRDLSLQGVLELRGDKIASMTSWDRVRKLKNRLEGHEQPRAQLFPRQCEVSGFAAAPLIPFASVF